MKPAHPPPTQPNGLLYESLDQMFRAVIAVPKAEIDRREEEWKRAHPKIVRKKEKGGKSRSS